MLPAHPAFGFMHAITTRGIRACTIAPAHIWHGSRVTYIVHSSSLQSPITLLARFIAVISAWASVFLSVFLRLYPLPITVPSCTITHPIGTSPKAYAFLPVCRHLSYTFRLCLSYPASLLPPPLELLCLYLKAYGLCAAIVTDSHNV